MIEPISRGKKAWYAHAYRVTGLFRADTRGKAHYLALLHISNVFPGTVWIDIRVTRAPQYDDCEFNDGVGPGSGIL